MSTVPESGAGRQPGESSALPPQPGTPKVIQHPSIPIPDPIPGIIPAKSVSLIAGASGVGKTALTAEWCARFLEGRTIFGHTVHKPPFVGVLVVDRKWASHGQWFAAVGHPEIPHYSYQDDLDLNWNLFHLKTELVKLLDHGIQSIKAPRGSIILVDPISMFIPGNLIDYKATAIGLGAINRYCEAKGITLLGTAHMGKQKGEKKDRYARPQDRILGSAALSGFTDTQMYLLGPDETEEEYYGFGWVPHHAPAATYELTRDPSNGLFIPYYSHDVDQDRLGLLKMIPESLEGIPAKDIVQDAGETLRLARATVYRYLQELRQLGHLKQPKAGRWYRLGPVPTTLMKLPKPNGPFAGLVPPNQSV